MTRRPTSLELLRNRASPPNRQLGIIGAAKSSSLWARKSADSGGAAPLIVDAADFDGTNDWMTRASFTGQADSKSGILYFWFRTDTVAGAGDIFGGVRLSDSKIILACYRVGDRITMEAHGATAAIQLQTASTISTATWYSLLISWDANVGAYHMYLNDVNDASLIGTTNVAAIYSGVTQWTCGDYSPSDGNGSKIDGGLAELYFAPGQYLDFSVVANRRKFVTSLNKPANLGATGNTPTGVAPLVYLHLNNAEAPANFATNRSGAGNMTISGALTTHASSPSD